MPSTSQRSGMGSIPFAGGVAFRVWAPFASLVEVALYDGPGQDVQAPSTTFPLAPESNGYWSTDVPGIGPGRLYRLRITNRETGASFAKIDPYVRQVTNSVGLGVVREPDFPWTDHGFRMPDFNQLIIYQIHLGTFDDDPGDRPGTLARATARLDHVKDLGVNCVHVLPPGEFATDFSWGYNVALPFAIEEAYGGVVEFKKFVDRAHALDIAVLACSIFNHFGYSDLDSCLWRFDGWHQGDHGGIYFYNDWRQNTDWGPRPDFGRTEVRQYIRDYVMYLLGECHCDGVRIDSTCNIWGFNHGQGWNAEGYNLLRWISDEKNHFHRYPRHKLLIAEDWHNDGWVTRPTPEWGAGMDAEWHWFVHPVRDALHNPFDEARNMASLEAALYSRFNGDAFKRVIYTESHDESGNDESLARLIYPRDPDSWFARKRTTLGAAMAMTAPGIPMLWQGQEIHSIERFNDQVPLDWSRKSRYAGIFQLYQDLCRLRRNWYDNTRGLRGQHIHCHLVDDANKVIAFHRWSEGGPGDDVVVILNFANRRWDSYRIGLPREGLWWCRFSSDWSGYSPDFGNIGGHPVSADPVPMHRMNHSGGFQIAPYSALIFSQ